MNYKYIKGLIDQWVEIYMTMDKRTIKAREIKGTINELFKLIGLV